MTAGELRTRLPMIRAMDKALANAIATALVWRHDNEEIPMSPEIEERLMGGARIEADREARATAERLGVAA